MITDKEQRAERVVPAAVLEDPLIGRVASEELTVPVLASGRNVVETVILAAEVLRERAVVKLSLAIDPRGGSPVAPCSLRRFIVRQ